MRLDNLQAQIKALSLKERIGLFLAATVVIYGAWDFALYQPLIEKEKSVLTQKENKTNELMALSTQLQKLSDADSNSPEAKRQRHYESLLTQITSADEQIQALTDDLIKPDQMAGVIETVLIKSEGLEIDALKGLGAESVIEEKVRLDQNEDETIPLVIDQDSNDPDAVLAGRNGFSSGAWRHGLTIEFSGGYLQTLDYLKALEALPWTFFWDSIELNVEEFPRAKTAITVYTLSLDESWIGV